MCTSVPHTPARLTRISTSLSRILGCGTSRSSNPGPAAPFTNALTNDALDAGVSRATRRRRRRSRKLAGATERGKCGTHAHDASRGASAHTHLLAPRAIRYCVCFHSFLYSRKMLVIRAGSSETRAVGERDARTPRVLRGFYPKRVADQDIISRRDRIERRGSRLLRHARFGAPRAGHWRLHLRTIRRHRRAHFARVAGSAAVTERTGRASCGQRGSNAPSTSRHDFRGPTDMAVKNLRIVGSAVLPLNFPEVRGFHLCSTSVAM